MNFYRPHFFALEALPELEVFVEAFDLTVEDPQVGGMGEREFVGFLFGSGWSEGNRLERTQNGVVQIKS